LLSIIGNSRLLRADVTGKIIGTVTDPTGAVVPGAKVTLRNPNTGLVRTLQTDASGSYEFLLVPIGEDYVVEAEAAGFQKGVEQGITLTVNQVFRADLRLILGSATQKVEVSAAIMQVETTSTQLGDVIDDQKMTALPLNGRSYIDLLGLQAGVAPTTSGTGTGGWAVRLVSGELDPGYISVNGQREDSNAFLVNGGDVSEGRNLGTSVIPNLDSVAEFRLLTNSFDAEYGKFTGSVMNAITKSGTNGFHGTVFEFVRNDVLDSRNFFDPTRGSFKRNQFGYAVGGPLIKNKVFWFTDYQGTREIQGMSTGLVQLPTIAERAGDFSGVPGGLSGSVNGPYWAQVLSSRLGYAVQNGEAYSSPSCTSTAACVFPGEVIPQSAFDSPVLPTMPYIPRPNVGTEYYSATPNQTVRDDKAGQRIDVSTRKAGNWYVYYLYDDSTYTAPLPYANVPGFPDITPTRAQEALLHHTYTFGPSAVNEVHLSFMRNGNTQGLPIKGFGNLSSLGFVTGANTLGIVYSGPSPGSAYEGLPPLSFLNFTVGNYPLITIEPDNTWHAADNLSKIHDKHTLKFGGEYRYYQVDERNIPFPNGDFGFNGSETGIDFADYLIGAPVGYTQSSIQMADLRTKYSGAYAQDSFRVRPNFTLNYGVRWEVNEPWYDTQGRIETINASEQSVEFPTAPLGWVVPGDPGIPSTLSPTRYLNFAPRLGLAYSPNFSGGVLEKIFGDRGKTSIRASYGIFYGSTAAIHLFNEVGDAPYGLYWGSIVPPLFSQPFLSRAGGASQVQRFPFVFPIPGAPSNKTLDYSIYEPIAGSPGYDIHNRLPYAEHYNLSIQRALSGSMMLTLSYIGTQGHRLLAEAEANPGSPSLCLSLQGSGIMAGTPACGPYGENGTYEQPNGTFVYGTRSPLGFDFGSDDYDRNFANSNYNAFQASLERKSGGSSFLAAYTYAKSIDDGSGYGAAVNYTNYRLSRGLSNFDQTQIFVISYNYRIPLDKGIRALPRLTRGWSLSGITRFATGFPVGIGESDDNSLTGSGSDEPDYFGHLMIQNPRKAGINGPNQYFSPQVFGPEPIGQFGNANARFFHGPGFNNWDVGLHKDTAITEHTSLQFRAEFFNVFNHAQFNSPVGNIDSSQFGQVISAQSPRIGQLSLKFLW
jgi:hypothetical protein